MASNKMPSDSESRFFIKAAVFIVVFIVAGNVVASQSGITGQLSTLFYSEDTGQVAGEFTVRMAASGANFNPSYPRIGFYAPDQWGGWPFRSLGSRLEMFKKHDLVVFGESGAVNEPGIALAQEMKKINPSQIQIAMVKNGLWFADPAQFFAYRAYQGHLTRDHTAGEGALEVDATTGINTCVGANFQYLVIVENLADFKAGRRTNYESFQYTIDGANKLNLFGALTHNYPAGATILSPLRLSGPGVWINLTDYAPADPATGKRAAEYFIDKNINSAQWDKGYFDGILHDFFSYNLWLDTCTIDFDLNGENDLTQFGKDSKNEFLIEYEWRKGLQQWLELERARIDALNPGGKNIILVNNGGTLPDYFNLLNSHIFEGLFRYSSWNFLREDSMQWMAQGKKPAVMLMEDFVEEKNDATGKNDFRKMRFGLATAMLFDAYYGMTFGNYYYNMFWYDEFETDLGYPAGPPLKLSGTAYDYGYTYVPSDSVWARFFDQGMVLVNPTGQTKTVTIGEASALAGYNGPYYRLRGGQDAMTNNGEIFDAAHPITLVSGGENFGDGILLFKNPTTAVSDIVIDNFNSNGTSPGSQPVELAGNWQRQVSSGSLTIAENNPYWSQDSTTRVIGAYDGAYGYHVAAAGSPDIAKYTPSIGLAGEYEIYEWHGWHGDSENQYNEATNAPYKIVVNGSEVKSGTINQRDSAGQGKWNLLGTFDLPAGETSYVQIAAVGADETVIADAVKFALSGNGGGAITPTPSLTPDLNCDGKVDVFDLALLMYYWDNNSVTPTPSIRCDNGVVKNADFDSDDMVDAGDLGWMATCWGVPPLGACWINGTGAGDTPGAGSCGNGIQDSGEVCDPGPPEVGAPEHAACRGDCAGWSCEYGYSKQNNVCVPTNPAPAGNCQQNQYSKDTIIPPAYDTFVPPVKGASYDDPAFCTTIKRLTDSGTGYITNSEPMYFNLDDSYFMAIENNVNYLYNGQTGERVKEIGTNEMKPWWLRWARADKFKAGSQYVSFDPKFHFYKFGQQIKLYDVRDLSSRQVRDFSSQYIDVDVAGGEGDLSFDGRYMLLNGRKSGGGAEVLFVYDLEEGAVVSESNFDLGCLGCSSSQGDGVDYATISPSGKYVAVAWHLANKDSHFDGHYGVELFNAATWQKVKQLNEVAVHWELGYDSEGNEMFYSMAGNDDADLARLRQTHNISDLNKWNIFGAYLQYAAGKKLLDTTKFTHHIETFANSQNSYLYIAFEKGSDNPSSSWAPYWGEIVEIPTDGSGAARRLLHHRVKQGGKLHQPDIIVGNNGRTLVYKSGYGTDTPDLYLVSIPDR